MLGSIAMCNMIQRLKVTKKVIMKALPTDNENWCGAYCREYNDK